VSSKTMSKKRKLPTRKFDVTEYLDSQDAIAEYLTAMIETGDASMVAIALGDVAKVKGMTEIAKASGLTREALYKALRADAQPRFDTVNRVCLALGVKLVAQPQ
jgi:probable addiction module antidote protein